MSILLIGLDGNNGNVYAQQERGSESDFSFVAAGDWGCDEKARRTAKNMQNMTPDLVIALVISLIRKPLTAGLI